LGSDYTCGSGGRLKTAHLTQICHLTDWNELFLVILILNLSYD
jgi:hypothetical protein